MTDAELHRLASRALEASAKIKLHDAGSNKNQAALRASRVPVREIREATKPAPPPPPPPPPDPEPPPPTPGSEQPFLDMSQVEDWHGTNANPGDITDVAGGIQLRVPNDHEAGSKSGNPRAELLTAPLFTNGDEVWLRTRIWLSPGVPSGWMTLASFFNAGGSIAPWHLSCVGGKFGHQAPAGNMVWFEPVVTGKWIDVLHHHRFGTGVQLETWIKVEGEIGWRQVWGAGNGKSDTWTSGNNGAPNYYKNCVYYQKGTAPGGVYTAKFGRTLLGDTRGSVVGFEGGAVETPPVEAPPTTSSIPPGFKAVLRDNFAGGDDAPFLYAGDNTAKLTFDRPTATAIITTPANTTNPRGEFSVRKPGGQEFVEGDEFYFDVERWLASGTTPGSPGNHFTLEQFKGLQGRYPQVACEYGNYSGGRGWYTVDKNRSPEYEREADYALGTWHKHRLHVVVSVAGRGLWESFLDGALVARHERTNTLEAPSDRSGFYKFGAYGQPGGAPIATKLRNAILYMRG